jgi:hypothetical protein
MKGRKRLSKRSHDRQRVMLGGLEAWGRENCITSCCEFPPQPVSEHRRTFRGGANAMHRAFPPTMSTKAALVRSLRATLSSPDVACPADQSSPCQGPEDVALAPATSTATAANNKRGFEEAMLRVIAQSEVSHPRDVCARTRVLVGVFRLRGLAFCVATIMVRTLQPFILASWLMLFGQRRQS